MPRSITDKRAAPDRPAADVPIALWLLPCADDAQWLQHLIFGLAQGHGTPPFEPHVSLHVGNYPPAADIAGAIAATASGWPPLDLNARVTRETDAYYRSVFVEIAEDEADGPHLAGLRRQLVQALCERAGHDPQRTPLQGDASADTAELERELAGFDFRPHLSLLYSHLAQPVRAALARENDLRGRRIVFDRISAVRPAAGCPDLSQVPYWEVFGHQRMTGQAGAPVRDCDRARDR